MNEALVLEMLEGVGAIVRNDHILYTSGRHGRDYVNKDAVYPYLGKIGELCREMARQFQDDGIEVVIGPAIGGVILSQWVTFHLLELGSADTLSVYAEKEKEDFVIKRGYEQIVRGKRVLVVEDVLTTGGSAKKVIEVVRANEGVVCGLAVLCNRGGVTPEDIGNPPKLIALSNLKMESWVPADCPMCKDKIPFNQTLGKGREFMASQMNL